GRLVGDPLHAQSTFLRVVVRADQIDGPRPLELETSSRCARVGCASSGRRYRLGRALNSGVDQSRPREFRFDLRLLQTGDGERAAAVSAVSVPTRRTALPRAGLDFFRAGARAGGVVDAGALFLGDPFGCRVRGGVGRGVEKARGKSFGDALGAVARGCKEVQEETPAVHLARARLAADGVVL